MGRCRGLKHWAVAVEIDSQLAAAIHDNADVVDRHRQPALKKAFDSTWNESSNVTYTREQRSSAAAIDKFACSVLPGAAAEHALSAPVVASAARSASSSGQSTAAGSSFRRLSKSGKRSLRASARPPKRF